MGSFGYKVEMVARDRRKRENELSHHFTSPRSNVACDGGSGCLSLMHVDVAVGLQS